MKSPAQMLWGLSVELPAWTCGPLKAAILSVACPPAGVGLEHTYTFAGIFGGVGRDALGTLPLGFFKCQKVSEVSACKGRLLPQTGNWEA